MKTSRNEVITSNVVGLSYTDIVIYIIPGYLSLIGAVIIFQFDTPILEFIRESNSLNSLLAIIFASILAFPIGIIISIPRWYIYPRQTSLGKLLLQENKLGMRKSRLPNALERKAIEKTLEDLKKLNWIDSSDENVIQSESRENLIELFDCFLVLLVNELRISQSPLFSHYKRWKDLHEFRINLCTTLLIIYIFLFLQTIFKITQKDPTCIILAIIIIIVLFVLTLLFVLNILPNEHIKDIKVVLFAYLSGHINVVREKIKTL